MARKQKAFPGMIVSVVVLAVGTLMGVNLKDQGLFGSPQQGTNVGVTETDNSEEMAKQMDDQIQQQAGGTPRVPRNPDTGEMPNAKTGKPSVEVDKPQKYVPKPTDHGTSSLWYTDEANTANEATGKKKKP